LTTAAGASSTGQALVYRTGPFVVQLETDYPPLLRHLRDLYPATPVYTEDRIINFRIRMPRATGIRGYWRRQMRFFIDDTAPFEPYPLDHAFPFLEWGLNWCIAMRSHQYLMLHAGVVERGGRALILPALPGSGKSTLSAGLASRGWRLLSDEFGLVRPALGDLMPLPRAIPLKNASIPVIRRFAPDAFLGPLFEKTRKGDVAHMRPPGEALLRQREPADPRWVVFPHYTPETEARLEPLTDSRAFTRLAHNAFNYRLLGETGFRSLAALVRRCDCYSLEFADLEAATAMLRGLSEEA
jgi:HprK-related kinase A